MKKVLVLFLVFLSFMLPVFAQGGGESVKREEIRVLVATILTEIS